MLYRTGLLPEPLPGQAGASALLLGFSATAVQVQSHSELPLVFISHVAFGLYDDGHLCVFPSFSFHFPLDAAVFPLEVMEIASYMNSLDQKPVPGS